jgi:phosphonate transport system substrate-binding protein
VPQENPSKMYAHWEPFIKELSKLSGYTIELKIEKSIPQFEAGLMSGEYDIAYCNPLHASEYAKKFYTPVAKDQIDLIGILVAKTDSNISNIKDVVGKKFLFPAPHAFAATVLTKFEVLQKTGYDIDKSGNFEYVNSHESVYKGIARGVGDVGGGIMRTLALSEESKNGSLKVIYKTKAVPSHPFIEANRLSEKEKNAINDALFKMQPQILQNLAISKLVPTNSAEYKNIFTK